MVDTNSETKTQAFSTFLLGLIRAATLRCDLDSTELKSVGVALKNNWINPEQACAWLADVGLIKDVIGRSPIGEQIPVDVEVRP
jgi:hypothetical protein